MSDMPMAAILLSFLLCIVAAVHAVDHPVGGNSGWTQMVNYTAWAAGQRFAVGDNLVFTYGPNHDVAEVNESGYDDCEASSSSPPQTGGRTIIPLSAPGTRYFICAVPTHCSSGGMKVAVTVEGGSPPPSGAPPSGTPPASTPPPASPNTPPSGAPPASTPPATPNTPPSGGPPASTPPATPNTPSLSSPPPPSGGGAAGNFGSLNSLLVGSSIVLATLFAFMG